MTLHTYAHIRAHRVYTCARSVIKVSAQTDKHSFHPTLITRCVIYHAHVYNARVKTNLYGRESNCSAHYFLVVLIIDAIGRAPRFSININARRVINVMNHSHGDPCRRCHYLRITELTLPLTETIMS